MVSSFQTMRPVGAGLVGFAFDRVGPAVLFGAMTLPSLDKLTRTWQATVESSFQSRLAHALDVGHVLLTLAFMAMLTILFLIRGTPVSGRATAASKLIALGGTFVMWIAFAQPITISDGRVLALADVLMIGGLAFALYAFAALRTCFGIAPEARGLVTGGAYEWVRHPAYLGEFVMAFGGLLPVLAPFTVLVFVLFCLLQARRAVLEEAVLSATFSEYAAYTRQTPAFVPWPRLRYKRGVAS